MSGSKKDLETTRGQPSSRMKRIFESESFLKTQYKSLTLGNFQMNNHSYLWIKKGDEKFTLAFNIALPAQIQAMAITAIQKNDEGYDVFYGVSLTDFPMTEHVRAKKTDISLQTCIWIDIDIVGGAHVGENYPHSVETAISFLPFEPSIIVNSGYGIHAYYLLSKALVIGDYNRHDAEERNRKLISIVRHNAGVYGKAVDSVQDLSRILRLPGTFNYKSPTDVPPLCRVIELNDTIYSVDEIDELIEPIFNSIHEQPKNLTVPTNRRLKQSYPLIQKVENPPESTAKEVNRAELIQLLKATSFETFFSERDKVGGWICPKCGSGSGSNGTGITRNKDNKYRCWRCNTYGDIIDWIQDVYVMDFNNALEYGAKVLNLKYYNFFSTPIKIDTSQFKFRKD